MKRRAVAVTALALGWQTPPHNDAMLSTLCAASARPCWRLALWLLALANISGCSSQAWYEGLRTRAANECAQLPGSAYEDCMRRLPPQRYEDYASQRSGR